MSVYTNRVLAVWRLATIAPWAVVNLIVAVVLHVSRDADDELLTIGQWLLGGAVVALGKLAVAEAFVWWGTDVGVTRALTHTLEFVAVAWTAAGGAVLFCWQAGARGEVPWLYALATWGLTVALHVAVRWLDLQYLRASPVDLLADENRPSFGSALVQLVALGTAAAFHVAIGALAGPRNRAWPSVRHWLFGTAVLVAASLPIYILYYKRSRTRLRAALTVAYFVVSLLWTAVLGTVVLFSVDTPDRDTFVWGYALSVWATLLFANAFRLSGLATVRGRRAVIFM